MTWEGKQEVEGFFPGNRGWAQLGDSTVPPMAKMIFAGVKGSPDLVMIFEVRDGRPECTEITIKAKPKGRGIRTADTRMFNVDDLTVSVFAQLGNLGVHEESRQRQTLRDVHEARTARRGSSVSREELETVARIYRQHFDHAPTAAVTKILGYRSERTGARRVQQARAAGLLPKTTKGKKA